MIGKILILPSIERQYRNSSGFQIAIGNKMRRVLDIQEVPRRPKEEDIPAKCGQCFKCVKAVAGCDVYKKARKKNNKLKSKCGKFNIFYVKFMSRV